MSALIFIKSFKIRWDNTVIVVIFNYSDFEYKLPNNFLISFSIKLSYRLNKSPIPIITFDLKLSGILSWSIISYNNYKFFLEIFLFNIINFINVLIHTLKNISSYGFYFYTSVTTIFYTNA